MFSVLILLFSSIVQVQSVARKGRPQPDASPLIQNASAYVPYLANTSEYPVPDMLSNLSGNISLPELASTTSTGTNTYELAFVEKVKGEGTLLEFDTGTYDPSLAQAIYENRSCRTNCSTPNLPIRWGAPTAIAAYGSASIQGDAIASTGYLVYVAATSNNTTQLFMSAATGESGTWRLVTQSPVPGIDPRLAAEECRAMLTTLDAGILKSTRFTDVCPSVPSPPGGSQGFEERPLRSGQNAGIPMAPPPMSPPSVTNVTPDVALAGSTVNINGTGFQNGVLGVNFGGVPAISYQVTGPSTLVATVPNGGGTTNVIVTGSYGQSQPSCPSEFEYGTIPPWSPQVENINPATGSAGAPVTIWGDFFDPLASVNFGGTSASVTYISDNELLATAPTPPPYTGYYTATVSVSTSYGASQQLCGDLFTYPLVGPWINSISPTNGLVGATVTLQGLNFSSSANVYFGNLAASSVTWISATSMKAVAPAGSGTVAVTVKQAGYTSNSVYFTYNIPGAQLISINPNPAFQESYVTLTGVNFSTSATVYFGAVQSSSVTWVSSTDLNVLVPVGAGAVPVTVRESGYTSNGVGFTYNPAPSVTYITPPQGPVGAQVAIHGIGFAPVATVTFGSTSSTSVTFVSSTELLATAPNGSGTVPVTVQEYGLSSAVSCTITFAYGTALPAGYPLVYYLTPTYGEQGEWVTIHGSNLSSANEAYFGGSPSITVSVENSSTLSVGVPLGNGTVPVRVVTVNGSSPASCSAVLHLEWPGALPAGQTTQTLYSSLDATPIVTVGGFEVVASNTTDSRLVLYLNSSTGGVQVHPRNITSFNTSGDSSVFNAIGDTNLFVPGGDPGRVAAVSNGTAIFAAITTDAQDRTMVEVASTQDQVNWSGPYLTGPQAGSVANLSATLSPSDYVFLAWQENGQGPWSIDEAAFTLTAAPILLPAPLTGSGGLSGPPAGAPTIAVDDFDRPLILWGTANQSDGGAPMYTGAYLSPQDELRLLQAGFNSTSVFDFLSLNGQPGVWSQGLSNFTAALNDSFAGLRQNLSSGALCVAQEFGLRNLYANLSRDDSGPTLWGPALPNCTLYEGYLGNSLVENMSGMFTPNFLLSVEARILLESMGVGTMPVPVWTTIVSMPSYYGPFVPGVGATDSDKRGDSVSVEPESLTPTDVWLNTSAVFPMRTSGNGDLIPYQPMYGIMNYTAVPSDFWANVSVEGVTGHSSSRAGVPSVLITHLPQDTNGSWSERITVTFNETAYGQHCMDPSFGCFNGTRSVALTSIGTKVQWTLSGTWTTGLDPFPASLTLHEWDNQSQPGDASYTLNWTNTVDAMAQATLSGYYGSGYTWYDGKWTNNTPRPYDNLSGQGFQAVPKDVDGSYTFGFNLKTDSGQFNYSWPAMVNSNVSGDDPNVETVSYSCTFAPPTPPIMTWNSSNNITDVTYTTATVTWYSPSNGSGWVDYNDSGGPRLNQTAARYSLDNGTEFEYVALLRNLDPWGIYRLQGYVETLEGCQNGSGSQGLSVSVAVQNSTSVWLLWTPGLARLAEVDLPYDSITQQGGGAMVYWQVPTAFTLRSLFDSGYLTFNPVGGGGSTELIPLSNLTAAMTIPKDLLAGDEVNTTYVANLSSLTLDTEYSVSLLLNYTLLGFYNTTAGSLPFTFWYERDTSGDGLTDAEKVHGWNVTTEDANGVFKNPFNVSAVPADFASNGLVGDYVEKEFGLDPRTVDTAGSHMLDTWNLTFNLGPNSGQLPEGSNVATWNQGSVYDPFATTVQYSPGLFESGQPIAQNVSNISADEAGGVTSGDGAPWAAEALWSYSALQKFATLTGVKNASWLRGVEGEWDGIPTVTLWGKLSWGANPLASSTPADGITDGERVNPVYEIGIQITLHNENNGGNGFGWYTQSCGTSGNGMAVKYQISDPSNEVITGYSSQVYCNFSPNGTIWPESSSYTVIEPVDQTYQQQQVQFTEVENTSTCQSNCSAGPFEVLPIDGTSTSYTVSVDLLGPATRFSLVNGSSSQGSPPPGYLAEATTVVPMGMRQPTYLWVPNDNSTLSTLPQGLQRYVGEQDFVLVEANDSYNATMTSNGVPLPWSNSSTYTVSASVTNSSTMVNFLVPVNQFLNSPLGMALANQTMPYNSSSALPIEGGSISTLACDWQERAVSSGASLCGGSGGTTPGSVDAVTVMADQQNCTQSPSSANCKAGGTPGKTGLANAALPANATAPSLQEVITLNLTSASDLNELLAGLLDNATGGVNGTLLDVTAEVGELGLNAVVLGALSNATYASDGIFGAPMSLAQPPPPPPPNCGGWSALTCAAEDAWNAVAGAVKFVVDSVVEIAGLVWSAAEAAAAYLAGAAKALARVAVQFVDATVQAMESAGVWLEEQAARLLAFIEKEAAALLSAALSPIINGIDSYVGAVEAAATTAYSDAGSPSGVTSADASGFFGALGGSAYLVGLGIGATVEIALVLLTPIDIGPSFIISTLIGIIVGTALITLATSALFSFLDPPSGVNQQALQDVMNYTNTTALHNNSNYSASWEVLFSVFSYAGKFALLPFSIGLLALERKSFPVLPAISLSLIIVGLIIDFVLLSERVPNMVLVLFATVLGAMLVLIGVHERKKYSGGLAILNYLDIGLSGLTTGFSVWELLKRYI